VLQAAELTLNEAAPLIAPTRDAKVALFLTPPKRDDRRRATLPPPGLSPPSQSLTIGNDPRAAGPRGSPDEHMSSRTGGSRPIRRPLDARTNLNPKVEGSILHGPSAKPW